MKVKDLVKTLIKLDQELEVITAKDEEGNGYNKLHYSPSEAYCGDLEQHWIEDVTYSSDFEDGEKSNCVVL